ncbi:MAG: amylo-alpha-1,6-glucosidase [Actinomycetota bacterium]|nr:amylo-alpha-1,6-glucosidase [Actinomycetota bacterium]
MDVAHFCGDNAVVNRVEAPVAFILVNDRKDFATFYETPQTRYEGFFAAHGDTFIKTLSRIVKHGVADRLEFYHDENVAARRYGAKTELYSVIPNEPVLVYEASGKDTLLVRLDMRDQFYIPQWGRNYDFSEHGDAVIVRYSDDRVTEPVYLAVLHDGNFSPLGSWVPVEYGRDKERYSEPAVLYEYELGRFNAKRLVFAFGASEAQAVALAEHYADHTRIGLLQQPRPKLKRAGVRVDSVQKHIAAQGAEDALDALFIDDRMLAGMPWFTKAWVRDELISLPALPKERARAVIAKYIHGDWGGGRLPVIFGGRNCCSDGLGLLSWAVLFGRISLDDKDKQALAFKLMRAIDELEETENEYGFIPSHERESWMDSLARTGYPVETQALYSKVLHLGEFLTESDYYKKKRATLLKNIHTHYFIDGYLHDRLYDDTMRPNVFLAALFAPELLTKVEWESCFDKVLPALWLEWGGLASVDKRHESFCHISVGEHDTSYHNGDSWFFVNNIAALVLRNINADKYAKYIDAILDASTRETLWHNYAGRPGEISSARALESWGCGLQGFSAAAYVYLSNREPIRRRSLGSLFAQPSKWQKSQLQKRLTAPFHMF